MKLLTLALILALAAIVWAEPLGEEPTGAQDAKQGRTWWRYRPYWGYGYGYPGYYGGYGYGYGYPYYGGYWGK